MAVETTTIPEVHDAAAESVAGVGTPHEAGGGGLPQFQFEHWGGQIVWLLIIFTVLYLILAKVFVPRLRRIQDERADTIAQAVEQARRVQAEADAQAAATQAEIDQSRASARRIAADAKAKAAAELAASQAAEDERLAGELAQAEARIREMRDRAMLNVQTIATDTAKAIVEKLTGKAVTAAELAKGTA
ncbi:MAG: atpB [Caulobacteraceae bacterium]|nr:atpB [Caulobacteraceae bacterium]